MSRKRNLVQNVEHILVQHEEARDNDKVLLTLYWEKYDGVRIENGWLNTTDFALKATPPSSIIRARRMVTEKRPELNANEHSKTYRENKRLRMVESVKVGEVI